MISHIFSACLMVAAQSYQVPPAVLMGIYYVEGGKVGQAVKNTNGSYDLGPMQINTLWIPELSKHWGVSKATAKRWIKDDPCTNVNVAAWIFRKNWDEAKTLTRAIAWYNSRTPSIGKRYMKKVIDVMKKKGLLKVEEPAFSKDKG